MPCSMSYFSDKDRKNTSSPIGDVGSPRSRSTGGGGGGSDWLGLGGGDDTGLELELPTYKPPTPARRLRNEPEQTGKRKVFFTYLAVTTLEL